MTEQDSPKTNPESPENQADKVEVNVEKAEVVETTAEATKASTAEAAVETATEAPEAAKKKSNPNAPKMLERGPHDDFDWDVGNKSNNTYDAAQTAQMREQYDSTFRDVSDNTIVTGTVMAMTTSDVVLNIGFKSDGLISTSEFRDMDELKAGDEVEVYVVKKEDERGQLILSRKNAKLLRAWENITDAYKTDKVVTGTIVSKTKGGLITEVFGLETFLPGSQIDVKPIIDYDAYVGKKMEFKVVKINEAIKNAVVSHKALIESDIEEQRQKIISKLEKGQVLEGTIKNITDFGAFIDLGGVDGLLYITDISWGRISHPKEVLELNQKLNVVVLDFDDAKKRISLGLKQLTPHPWDVLPEDVKEGSKVKGKIVNIEDYGAFLEIVPGVEGLIHVSEVSWSNQPINSKDFFKLGEEHEAMVVTIDREDRKMSLSLKQLSEDPWQSVATKYPVGSEHSGLVKNITPYGVFVELDENIGGMVHISDLSWTKRYGHPSEFTKVGETLPVVVLEIDNEGRKISLGHKQIEEDPWNTFESVFPIGSVHEATVIRKEDKGGIVVLPYGLEGFVPNRHLKKEDGKTLAEVDETLPFKVIEFDRNEKRIVVSHTNFNRDKNSETRQAATEERRTERTNTQTKMKTVNRKVEKSTLGDLDGLQKLKAQMESNASAPAAPAAKPAAPAEPVADAAAETAAKATEAVADATDAVADAKDAAADATEAAADTAAKATDEAADAAGDAAKKAEGDADAAAEDTKA